jgi:pyridoxal phosphate enzyme (YggS family)
VDADLVAERLARVRERIASAGVDPDALRVVAVTKGFGADAVRAAAAVGIADIGENYAPELLAKAAEVGVREPPLRWHAIGRMQRNKVRKLAGVVALWQSVDRSELAEEVARRAPGAEVLVQVDAVGEASKGGCEPAHTAHLVSTARGLGLKVEGLMTVAPAEGGEAAAAAFRLVRSQADDLGLVHCSMGMSGDYVEAARAGSTMLRLGRTLFGPRPQPEDVQN